MILLQVTQTTVEPWRVLLQDFNQIAQILGVIMVVLYVIYTYKTFRQIKKQTDYQQDAFLVIETQMLNEIFEQNEGTGVSVGTRIMRRNILNTKYLITDIPSNRCTTH